MRLGEPDHPITADCYSVRCAAGGRDRVFRDRASGGDAADCAGAELGKPHGTVRGSNDLARGPARAVGSGYSVNSVACPSFADAADDKPATTSSVKAVIHTPAAGRAPPRRSKTVIVYLPNSSSSCALAR